jgi:hypothetical protein
MELRKIRIIGDWQHEIEFYQPNFGRDYLEKKFQDQENKKDWENLNPHTVIHRQGGIKLNSRGFVDPVTMPTLEKIRKLVGLMHCQLIIQRYEQGETNLYHRDLFPSYDLLERKGLDREINDLEFGNPDYVRLIMMLKDRQPGQFMQDGDHMINSWKAGDIFYFNSSKYYHSAGNCGQDSRWILRITGKPTSKFNEFLQKDEHII